MIILPILYLAVMYLMWNIALYTCLYRTIQRHTLTVCRNRKYEVIALADGTLLFLIPTP